MQNVATLLDRNLDAGRGEQIALITDAGERWTYQRLHQAACRVAARLAAQGLRREERVLMLLDDTPAFPATFLGAMRIGAVPIPANFLARPDDIAYFLDDAYARTLVIDRAFVEKFAPALDGRDDLQIVVANGDAGPHESLDAWLAAGPTEAPAIAVHPEDMAFWLYSSGSTGRPKGVVHSHRDVWFTCERYAKEILETTPADVHFSTTKMFHAYGLGNNLTFAMWSGATAVYLGGRPSPARALEKVRSHRPTLLFSVPALYNMMLTEPALASTPFDSVRVGISAAEPLPPEVQRRFREATGVEILDGIGSTEMLHIYCSNRRGRSKPGTSGTPVTGYTLEIRDEDGRVQGPGASGQLFVRGGSALSFYWHQREKTDRSLNDGWFATGDRYHTDEDGCFSYEGRVDDMMKVGGLWVSPIDIENRLMEHEAVTEAAVVGVTEDNRTRIKAFIITAREPEDTLPDALRAWCKEALLAYQYPHLIEFVRDFPRTATGKVQRFKLRGLR